jgi:hypothetical protein
MRQRSSFLMTAHGLAARRKPVELPTIFEFTLNLKTVTQRGLTVSDKLLRNFFMTILAHVHTAQ